MTASASPTPPPPRRSWMNRTVLGIGLASLFSDWSHEIATAVLPTYIASLGLAAMWLGWIEGISDGLSSFSKMASGFYTDRLPRRKPVAVLGYLVTALGTASFGLASSGWHLLMARSAAWFGRGVRTPVRKALLAGAVPPGAYGRAFGFERMMDTVGAIIGPATALLLLAMVHQDYGRLFLLTLIPGLLAVACMAFLVQEKSREKVKHITFGESLRALPKPFHRFLLAVGVFGLGDFAHSMLILLATEKLRPLIGPGRAASVAVGLYVLHNVFYAGFAFLAGWMADRFNKKRLLAGGYFLAAVTVGMIVLLPPSIWMMTLVFVGGGIYVAVEETLEDSLCAELVSQEHHGMAFGSLATVNGVGDAVSSIVVGVLWTAGGTTLAFSFSGILFLAGGALVLRLPAHAPGKAG